VDVTNVISESLKFGIHCNITYKFILKTELFDSPCSEREHSVSCLPPCASDSPATYGGVQIRVDLLTD